jgi:hypothetical protein
MQRVKSLTIASEKLKPARNENDGSDDGERKETEDQSPLPPMMRLLHRWSLPKRIWLKSDQRERERGLDALNRSNSGICRVSISIWVVIRFLEREIGNYSLFIHSFIIHVLEKCLVKLLALSFLSFFFFFLITYYLIFEIGTAK